MKKVRLFLSSPGDVEPERNKVHSVVAQVDRMVGGLLDVHIEVIDWKTHVAGDMGRPQEVINRQIGDYDIFVGIMWKRFGTPTGKAGSGTEEEFNIAYKNWERFRRPRILFYFSTAQYTIQNDEEYDQLGRVREFRKKMRDKGLTREYPTLDDFADLLREHLVRVLEEWFSPKGKRIKLTDFSHYVRYLMEDTMYIDIRGLITGKGKAHRFPIDRLYIPLKTSGAGVEEGIRARGEINAGGIAEGIGPMDVFLQEALKRRRLIIKGDPGSGKTTFLRFITNTLCRKWLGEDLSLLNVRIPWTDTCPLPIFLRIGALIEHLQECREKGHTSTSLKEDNPECLFHFLEERAKRYNWKVCSEDFRAELDSGNCLILLDGLDEAPNLRTRAKISSLAENLLRSFPECQVVLTSRPPALDGPVIPPGFDLVEILPLDDMAKDFFLSQWSKELHHDSPEKAEEFKKELSGALQARPEIRRMASTPVMLTALAVVHWNEHRLPEQRSELYESIITWLLRSREQRPGRLSSDRCRRLLQKLALSMFNHPQGRQRQVGFKWAAQTLDKEFAATEEKSLLEQAEEFLCEEMVDSGIIVEREKRLEFWHLSFQEYLAASEIAGQRDDAQASLLFEGDRLYRSEWREVLLLLGGVLYKQGEEKINYLINQIIERGPRYKDKASLPELAREVGLLGGIVSDLSPFHFSPANEEYQQIVKGVMGIFEKESYQAIPVQVRIEAADALGRVGDPRLHDDPMVSIPGGRFWMGAQKKNKKERNFDEDARDNEFPVHEVDLSPYTIGTYPVTVGQYLRFIEDGGYQEKRYWEAGGFGEYTILYKWEEQLQYSSRPVVNVSWHEAAAYAKWCGCRLPTEAEWERAARGPGEEYRKYPWGDGEPTKDTANWDKAGVGKVTPVGIFPEDRSPEGVIDMAGNVWEWCRDWYSDKYYEECARRGIARDPVGPEKGEVRVVRGGCFIFDVPYSLRCADRFWYRPGGRNYSIGFRVVRLL